MLIPPSDIKKKIDALVQKLAKMFLTDIEGLPSLSDSIIESFESQSAEQFVSIVKEHMKSNKEYDFLRVDDNPYRPYYLRERMAAFKDAVSKHRAQISQHKLEAIGKDPAKEENEDEPVIQEVEQGGQRAADGQEDIR